jgi:membrane-bound serine protease (ClpP class)
MKLIRLRNVPLCLGLLLTATVLLPPRARAREVVVLTFAGPIGPVSADYIARGIGEAESRGAAAVILRLDTPGGLDSSMRQIIQREMNARVPVVVFVAPRGARAASAGCLIVLAADVAAMAPGTNLGAAHPVYYTGGAVSEKVVNDAIAYARSLAAAHRRNADWAEKAVRESASLPADEAVRLGVVDLAANDVSDLLSELNGRQAHTSTGEVTLLLAGAQAVAVDMDWRERLLGTLANPNLAYLLFVLGVLAVVVEVFAPHGMVTGTLGTVALLLGLVGLALLPVQLAGVALLVLGMVLLVLELKLTSHGLLTLTGLVAFLLGSLLLFPRVPGYGVSGWLIGAMCVLWAAALTVVVRLVVQARHAPGLMGVERVLGSVGAAKTDLAPLGVVLVGGEDWSAEAEGEPVARGEKVRVLAVNGLVLRVRKLV